MSERREIVPCCLQPWLFLALCFIPVLVQSQSLRFQTLSLEHGLSQSTVYAILRDRVGFMWFGTRDGLNRYDGKEFRVYRTQPGVQGTLSHPNVRAIVEDSLGRLWLGTDGGGLNVFDPHAESFTQYRADTANGRALSDDQILSLVFDRGGKLWIGTRSSGLCVFDPANSLFHRFQHRERSPLAIPHNTVWSLALDSAGTVWVATEQGLSRYRGDDVFETILQGVPVWSVSAGERGTVWAGTKGHGVFRIDAVKGSWQSVRPRNPEIRNLHREAVSTLLEDEEGRIWIGTLTDGLLVWDSATDKVLTSRTDERLPYSIRDNAVRKLYRDPTGMIWVGTNAAGVASSSPHRQKFAPYPATSQQREMFSPPVTLAFAEDLQKRIWIGTEQSGVFIFSRHEGYLTPLPYHPTEPKKLNTKMVVTLVRDRRGTVWVGTDGGGLERWSSDGTKLDHFRYDPDDPSSLSNNSVLTLHEDRRGNLWVGTYQGLNMLVDETRRFVRYRHESQKLDGLSDERILAIHERRDGTIWLGTHGGGLNRLNPATATIRRYEPAGGNSTAISSDRVNAIVETADGILWLGTYHGLNRFDPRTETFTHFTESNGLANSIVHGILLDDESCLWLSTNGGLSRFDPSTGQFQNYGIDNGVQSKEFKGGAYFRSSDGEFFFGGVNGFNVFRPEQVRPNPHVPPVVITEFRVGGILKRLFSERVELPHDYGFFAIHFAALDYVSPANNRYRYKLNGLETDWVERVNDNVVRYRHIPPGKYVFTVLGSNSDGVWNEQGASLEIIILRPWWGTWWFRVGAALFVLGLLYVGYRLRLQVDLREERLRTNIARNLHDDLSATLSSITFYAEAVRRSGGEMSDRYLHQISESAREAKERISDIIWSIDPRHDDWRDFLARCERYAADLLESREILHELKIDKSATGPFSVDLRQHLWLVFKELLVNLVRHSDARRAVITMNVLHKNLVLTVSDDGKGFDPSTVTGGHGLANVRKRVERLGGKATLEAAPGKGTRWRVQVPL